MSVLADDELDLILNRITDPDDRNSASLVCKQWFKVEGLSRSSITVTKLNHLHRILPRFPNLLMFKTSKTISNANLLLLAQTCPKLEAIDLGTVSIRRQVGDEGLCALASGCPNLTEVVLRRRHNVGQFGLVSLVTASRQNLTVLDLGFCTSVSDQVLAAIGCYSRSIVVLNLEYCYSITDRGLEFLANGCCSKSMKELVLAGCPKISDYGVSLLRKMCVLEELSLDDCRGNITDIGGVAISKIPTLKVLNLGMLRSVTNRTVVAVAQNCLMLEMLDVKGCAWVTGAGIRAFSGHKCLESLNLFCCGSYIRGHDLECVALGCPSLKSVVLDQKLGTKVLPEMQVSTVTKFLEFM